MYNEQIKTSLFSCSPNYIIPAPITQGYNAHFATLFTSYTIITLFALFARLAWRTWRAGVRVLLGRRVVKRQKKSAKFLKSTTFSWCIIIHLYTLWTKPTILTTKCFTFGINISNIAFKALFKPIEKSLYFLQRNTLTYPQRPVLTPLNEFFRKRMPQKWPVTHFVTQKWRFFKWVTLSVTAESLYL